MKLKGRLPKDDANGIEAFESELTGNLRNGKTVLAMVLLGTEDVLARASEPIVSIVDIEGVPEGERSHLLDVMSRFKSDRLGVITGQTSLDLDDEEDDGSH
jgi:hypothetical protein